MDLKERLKQLYNDASKHANYQNVPEFVRKELGYSETINEEWRGDTARYRYILQELAFEDGQVVGDVGANTGFFTLSLANNFKNTRFLAYEANRNHVEYIETINSYFDIKNVSIREVMIDLEGIKYFDQHDTLLFLNVLHHAGYDFDKQLGRALTDFKNYALSYLSELRTKASQLVFQMGSNWGGDKQNPIISREDDAGKIIYNMDLFLETGWTVNRIAVATRNDEKEIIYANLPGEIVELVRTGEQCKKELMEFLGKYRLGQFVGEFYRRPIFVCES